jgi:hypothetical protein
MLLRRLHLALFGMQHAPGTGHSSVAAVASAGQRAGNASGSQLELAAGGTLAFALIVLAEGHSRHVRPWELAATAAAAYAVALLARSVARLLTLSATL